MQRIDSSMFQYIAKTRPDRDGILMGDVFIPIASEIPVATIEMLDDRCLYGSHTTGENWLSWHFDENDWAAVLAILSFSGGTQIKKP